MHNSEEERCQYSCFRVLPLLNDPKLLSEIQIQPHHINLIIPYNKSHCDNPGLSVNLFTFLVFK